jgi:hypothetical protein
MPASRLSLAPAFPVHECPATPDLDRVERASFIEKSSRDDGSICVIGAVSRLNRLDVIIQQKIESI